MNSNYSLFCNDNFKYVEKSNRCVCIYCKKELLRKAPETLKKYEIVFTQWKFDEVSGTVICPLCQTDTVIFNFNKQWNRLDVVKWYNQEFIINFK